MASYWQRVQCETDIEQGSLEILEQSKGLQAGQFIVAGFYKFQARRVRR